MRARRRTGGSRSAATPRRRRGPLTLALAALAAVLVTTLAPAAHADEITDKRAEAQLVAAELNAIQGRLLELDREYSEANAALEDTNARIADAQARVDATSEELAEQRRRFQSFAVQAYVGGNGGAELDALLTSSGSEAPQKTSYLHAATGNRRDLQDRLRATTERLDDDIAELEATKAEAQTHLDEMAAARDESQAALDEQEAIKSRIDAELDVLVQEEQARLQAEREAAARQQAAQEAARQQAATEAQARSTTTNPAPAPANPGRPASPSPTAPTAPATPAPPTQPAPPPVTAPPAPPPVSGGAGAAVAAAQSALGVPYVPGGASMSGFDCSGLTSWAWAKGGKSLPRTTYGQWAAGQRVSLDALQPGDLVFYAGVSHVGLYVGGGSIIHAPNSRSVVRYDSVYWWGPIDGAVRP